MKVILNLERGSRTYDFSEKLVSSDTEASLVRDSALAAQCAQLAYHCALKTLIDRMGAEPVHKMRGSGNITFDPIYGDRGYVLMVRVVVPDDGFRDALQEAYYTMEGDCETIRRTIAKFLPLTFSAARWNADAA